MPNPSFMATPRAPMRGATKAPIAGQGTSPATTPAANISALAQARTTAPQTPVENRFAPSAPPARAQGGGQYRAPVATSPAPDPYKAALDTVSQARAGANAQGLTGNTGSAAGSRMVNMPNQGRSAAVLPASGTSFAGQAVAQGGLTPQAATSAYYGDNEQKNKDAQAQALYDALTGSNLDYSAMTPEMLAAQSQQLNAAGIQQQYDMQRALAAQGIGSGMGAADIAGLGVQTARSVSDAQTAAALQGQEARMQAIRDLMQGVSSNRSGDQAQQQIDMAKSESEYGRTQDAEANQATALNNYMGFTATDSVSPDVYSAAIGVDFMDPAQAAEFSRKVHVVENDDGTKTAVLTNPDPTSRPGTYAGLEWNMLTPEQQSAIRQAEQDGFVALDDPPPDYLDTSLDKYGAPVKWSRWTEREKAQWWAEYYAKVGAA